MACIAHISDLHFGRDLPAIADGLLRSLEDIDPELVVISGDLTQRATTREYREAARFLDKLPRPYMIVPGNHDLSSHHPVERFFYPWRKWRGWVDQDLEPVTTHPSFTAVGVNTARGMGLYLDWSRGRINHEQVRRVGQVFTAAPSHHLRVVVAHHPFWLPQPLLRRSLVGRRDAALQAFQGAGADLVLGGHVHLAYVEPVSGMIVSHAGTTISHRLVRGQPNSFNLVRGDDRQLEVEQWEWSGKAFRACECHGFRKQAGAWHAYRGSAVPRGVTVSRRVSQ